MSSPEFKILEFEGPLYRANSNTFIPGHKATNNYKNAPMKYFTLNKSEINTYTKYNKPYKKTWKTTESLKLLDILNIRTRRALEKRIGSDSLNIAFPILNGNKVSRVSEENTRNHDDKVLQAICRLGYDGYYMKQLRNNMNEYIFHSEIGLCKSAFNKLQLKEVEKTEVAPRAPNKTRKQRKTRRNSITNLPPKNTKFNGFRGFSLNNLNN